MRGRLRGRSTRLAWMAMTFAIALAAVCGGCGKYGKPVRQPPERREQTLHAEPDGTRYTSAEGRTRLNQVAAVVVREDDEGKAE